MLDILLSAHYLAKLSTWTKRRSAYFARDSLVSSLFGKTIHMDKKTLSLFCKRKKLANQAGLDFFNIQIHMLDNPLSATTTGIVIKLINTNSCLHFLYKHVFMFQSNCDQFALNTTNINSIKSANLSELFEEVQNYPLGLGKETETH